MLLSPLRVENPVHARKSPGSLLTTLHIVEERHLGSLTCHVLRSPEKERVYSHFLANSSTVFRDRPGAYDPHIFGRRTQRVLACNVYLRGDADFAASLPDCRVDLEVALILQPVTDRNGLNVCDVPIVARQTVTILFDEEEECEDEVGGRGGGSSSSTR